MQPFIVVSDGFDKELFSKLCEHKDLKVHPKAKLSKEELFELLPEVEGLVIRSATTVDADLLEKAPKLKYVIRAGEGTDNIDKVLCEKKGVKVSNTPGANNNSAGEHAIALMMTLLRHTHKANQSMKEGRWDKSLYTGNELTGKTVGIVGFGRIGQIVAKRLAGFEPKVLFFDPVIEKSDIPYATKAKDLKEVFSKSDIVTVHVPLMEQTKNLINKDVLGLMPSHSILVNASRGKIVNEDDLLDLLKNKKIKAAGFDVFATEPLPEDSPLRSLDNLLLTPHLGAATEEAQVRVGEMAADQLEQFFIHNNLVNQVRA